MARTSFESTAGARLTRNPMHPIRWVPEDAASLLDVGCNSGAFLLHCAEVFPALQLAGVEVNAAPLEQARRALPDAELHHAGGESLPFPDGRFDCVTCIEVLEHIPEEFRARALAEIRRVLRDGGRLVLRVPHAGLFAFLDPNNFRFRLPGLYRRLLGHGRRDAGYEGSDAAAAASGVVWHHHFTRKELLELAGPGWEVEAWRLGGLVVMPLSNLARWPFYRMGRHEHPIFRLLQRLGEADQGCQYGAASYNVLVVLTRV